MNAIVSGQARTALLINDDTLLSFDIDTPDILKPRRESDFRFLFGEATDLRLIQNTQQEDVLNELRADYYKTSALDLALMFLDKDISETKPLIAEALEEFFDDENIIVYLDSIFYAKTLPPDADAENALIACENAFPKTYDWLSTLIVKQNDIAWLRETWDAIATDVFGDEEKRADFQKAIVHEGIFRELVLHCRDNSKVNSINVTARMNRSIIALPNHRIVLQALFTSFNQPRVSSEEIRLLKDEREQSINQPTNQQRKKRLSFDRKAVQNNVESQIDYIAAALKKRDVALARKLTTELANYQSGKGEVIHLVKSLCQLAQKAKEFGYYKFQLELTERAIGLEYSDSWTQTQHGDALLQNDRLDDAIRTYAIAISFARGKDTENEIVARNGYAEILKAQGKLDEASKIYEEIMRSRPEDVVAKTGYAEVLKAQGRFAESLKIYKEAMQSHPENVVAKTGYAEVLKAQGKLDEALKIYEEIMQSHPEDVVARNGYAEVLKAQGKLDESLQLYQETMQSHLENVVARNGLCGVLFSLGKYDEALEKLPSENLITHSDWIGYHIRGMIMLKKGNLTEAVRIFEKGEKEDPIPSSKEYFRGALAVARLRQGEFRQAGELLDKVTSPILQPAINIFRAHTFGEMKMYPQAKAAFQAYENASISRTVAGYQNRNTLELAFEVNNRYVANRIRTKSDDWLFDKEEELLLALAP